MRISRYAQQGQAALSQLESSQQEKCIIKAESSEPLDHSEKALRLMGPLQP